MIERISSVDSSGFDVELQIATASGSVTNSDVYWLALEEGTYTLEGEEDVEVGTVNVSGLNGTFDWSGSQMVQITPTSSFSTPRFFTQIQTKNDTDWQSAWTSDSGTANPPTTAAFYVGRHVGADTNTTRLAEDVGYIVAESGTGENDSTNYSIGRTADEITGSDTIVTTSVSFTGVAATVWTEGRFGLQYNSSSGTGNAFPRPYWGIRHTNSTNLSVFRAYNGQNFVAWVQSIDLQSIEFTAGGSNERPIVSAVTIDAGSASITLTEGVTTNVTCEATISDVDGFADIDVVTADLYRASVGHTSSLSDNNHYRLSGDSECVPSNGSGNNEDYTCTFAVQYFADPTDSGSPHDGDDWVCHIIAADSVGEGSPAIDTIELDTLKAISVDASNIDFGTLSAGTNTGATNVQATITNTGNADINAELSGTDMSGVVGTIPVTSKKYNNNPFDYSTEGSVLGSSASTLPLNLPQPTSATLPVTDVVYFGLGVPNGTLVDTYTGQVTVSAD
jgi:hypothetical protein